AIVLPDQLEQLATLMARASAESTALVVLAIEQGGRRALLPRPAAELMTRLDAAARARVADAVRASVPVRVVTAAGGDAASTTLEIARVIEAHEVVVSCADAGEADEEARRAAAVWRALAPPKGDVVLRLVIDGDRCADRQVVLCAEARTLHASEPS
ncbi:MAG TPA: hypothetical protein VHB21_06690, partial [Minicystis sp.]|nr:hypothetical protein [Minicystis sp.]